jgi:hypothetical protein
MPRLIRHIVCFLLYVLQNSRVVQKLLSSSEALIKKKEGKNCSLVWFHLSVAPVHSRSAFASTSFLFNTPCICCFHLRLICGLKLNDYDSAVRLPSGYLSLELIFTEDKKKYLSLFCLLLAGLPGGSGQDELRRAAAGQGAVEQGVQGLPQGKAPVVAAARCGAIAGGNWGALDA